MTPEYLRELMAENSGVTPLILLTIDHVDLAQPARLALDAHDVWSRGEQYTAAYYKVQFPLDSGEELANTQLKVDNVDRAIVTTLRGLSGPPSVTLELVTDRDPDTVEMGPFDFELRNAEYDVLLVTGNLSYENILQESFPSGSYNPRDFPGLFS